jgi:hypothetical protein
MSHKRIVGDRLFSLDLHIWGSRNALSDCLFSGGAIRDVGAKNLLSLTSPGSLCCDFNCPTLCHCVPPANKPHSTTIRGQWRYLYRAIDKHGTPVDFLLTAKRDLEAAKRFFRKMLREEPLLAPDRIGTDGAGSYPPAIVAARKDGLLARTPVHYVTKHLQQGIESDHFRVKRPMPRVGCFQAFHTARRTIQGFEAMLWLRKGFGFAGAWTVREQNRLLALCFGLPEVNKA